MKIHYLLAVLIALSGCVKTQGSQSSVSNSIASAPRAYPPGKTAEQFILEQHPYFANATYQPLVRSYLASLMVVTINQQCKLGTKEEIEQFANSTTKPRLALIEKIAAEKKIPLNDVKNDVRQMTYAVVTEFKDRGYDACPASLPQAFKTYWDLAYAGVTTQPATINEFMKAETKHREYPTGLTAEQFILQEDPSFKAEPNLTLLRAWISGSMATLAQKQCKIASEQDMQALQADMRMNMEFFTKFLMVMKKMSVDEATNVTAHISAAAAQEFKDRGYESCPALVSEVFNIGVNDAKVMREVAYKMTGK